MKKVVAIVVAVVSMFIGIIIGCRMSSSLVYTVDRIEEGQNGEQWAVIEVYNSLIDEISMMDILVEEGYTVR